MAFKLKLSSTYTVDIALEIPVVGKTQRASFQIEFKRLTKNEKNALWDRMTSGELTDEQFISEVAVGWSGIQDENGNALPFNEESIAAACQEVQFAKAIVPKFFESMEPVFAKN